MQTSEVICDYTSLCLWCVSIDRKGWHLRWQCAGSVHVGEVDGTGRRWPTTTDDQHNGRSRSRRGRQVVLRRDGDLVLRPAQDQPRRPYRHTRRLPGVRESVPAQLLHHFQSATGRAIVSRDTCSICCGFVGELLRICCTIESDFARWRQSSVHREYRTLKGRGVNWLHLTIPAVFILGIYRGIPPKVLNSPPPRS